MIPKFRAWDKKYKAMEYTDRNLVVCFSDSGVDVVDHTNFTTSCIGMEYYELMQSTGLKDKNDVEIFEGDVIHLTSNNGIDYKALIIFKDGGFCAVDGVEDEYSTRRHQLHKGDCDFEVLGNQFEHPHLLEE
jgi:uncharacterized phage protein (TIGR01671 family)